MEVISSLFRIISSFLTDTLYAQSIINNLFSFDLDKKIITIKQGKKNNNISPNDELKIPIKNLVEFSPKNSIYVNDEQIIQTRNNLNEEALNKELNNNNLTLTAGGGKAKKKKKLKIKKKEITSNNILMNFESNEIKSKNSLENDLNKKDSLNIQKNMDENNNIIINEQKEINK